MTDSARNTRTLIVSFVFAIMALIPLRFVEVGQMAMDNAQVLGDQTYEQQELAVVLPEDGVSEEVMLEAPYNEIETGAVYTNVGTDVDMVSEEVLGEEVVVGEEVLGEETVAECIPVEEAKAALSEYEARLSEGGMDSTEVDSVVSEMIGIESSMCK